MTHSKRKDFHFIVLNPKKIVRILQKDQIRSDQKKKNPTNPKSPQNQNPTKQKNPKI